MEILGVSVPLQATGLLVAAIAVLVYAVYLQLLPKPIPGIPYHKDATRSILGDIPRFQREDPNNLGSWMSRQIRALDSPIVQLFIRPLGTPWVIVSDFREAQDTLTRRKEFDRSDFDIGLLGGLGDHAMITCKTNAIFRANRRLIKNLMSIEFLHNVAAPNIYHGALRLLDLWKMKTDISQGKAFAVEEDIFYAALDALYDFTFGDAAEHRGLAPQTARLKNLKPDEVKSLRASSAGKQAFEMPEEPIHESVEAFIRSLDPAPLVAATGAPKLAWKVAYLFPRIRNWRRVRRNFLEDQVKRGVSRMENEQQGEKHTKNAVDHILQQEQGLAQKENRDPVYWSPTVRDELTGFILAGHDTVSTTLCWAVKFLPDNPECQKRLRKELQASHSKAVEEQRLPTHDEINNANIPYVNAYVEELLRLAHTLTAQNRSTSEDTVLLGHYIPKGTTVFFTNRGPSFTEPPMPIAELKRYESSQQALKEGRVRSYDEYPGFDEEKEMNAFRPDRWLVANAQTGGKEIFDPAAWPTMPFGIGERGCFGRRLAYMELKLLLTLIVWTFEFIPCPESLTSYEEIQIISRKPALNYVKLKRI